MRIARGLTRSWSHRIKSSVSPRSVSICRCRESTKASTLRRRTLLRARSDLDLVVDLVEWQRAFQRWQREGGIAALCNRVEPVAPIATIVFDQVIVLRHEN